VHATAQQYLQDLADPINTATNGLDQLAATLNHPPVAKQAQQLRTALAEIPMWAGFQATGGVMQQDEQDAEDKEDAEDEEDEKDRRPASLVPQHIRRALYNARATAAHYSDYSSRSGDEAAIATNTARALQVLDQALSDDALAENVLFPAAERHQL
jgi:hypothetical protein